VFVGLLVGVGAGAGGGFVARGVGRSGVVVTHGTNLR
jgi:hypothetical protein